jgi:hypothetical protein
VIVTLSPCRTSKVGLLLAAPEKTESAIKCRIRSAVTQAEAAIATLSIGER